MPHALTQRFTTVFKNNKGYARTRDLTMAGIHTTQIKRLEDEGRIFKIKRGLYRLAEDTMESDEELVDISKIVPNGVICLLSSLSYHGITTYQPWEHYVAIHRDAAKLILPEYPPIRILFFSDVQYRVGQMEVDIHDHMVKMYDLEKTLCDCARYQNKIGKDVVKEGFKVYLSRRNKHVDKLLDYARQTRVESVVSQYVEVLI